MIVTRKVIVKSRRGVKNFDRAEHNLIITLNKYLLISDEFNTILNQDSNIPSFKAVRYLQKSAHCYLEF